MSSTCYEDNPSSAFEMIRDRAAKLGTALVEKAFLAYFIAVDPKTPAWARASLLAALAYVGLPLDGVPDPTPFIGFTDDLAVLLCALMAAAASVRVRHIRRARAAMRNLGMKVPEVDPELDDYELWPTESGEGNAART